MDQIYHYTPNTAHGRWSRRSEVDDATISHFTDILQDGAEQLCGDMRDDEWPEPLPLGGGWGIVNLMAYDSGAICWTICRHGVRLSYCWLMLTGSHANDMWPSVVRMADETEVLCARTCPQLPILATLLVDFHDAPAEFQRAVAESGVLSRESMAELADLERCLAWTLIAIHDEDTDDA